MMDVKLRPCPFCGSEKLKLVKKRAAYKGHKAYVASVRCNRKLRAAERIEMNCGGRKR